MFIPGFTAKKPVLSKADITKIIEAREKKDIEGRKMRKIEIDKLFPNRYGADIEAINSLPEGFN